MKRVVWRRGLFENNMRWVTAWHAPGLMTMTKNEISLEVERVLVVNHSNYLVDFVIRTTIIGKIP